LLQDQAGVDQVEPAPGQVVTLKVVAGDGDIAMIQACQAPTSMPVARTEPLAVTRAASQPPWTHGQRQPPSTASLRPGRDGQQQPG
jgi:hypothetical protein